MLQVEQQVSIVILSTIFLFPYSAIFGALVVIVNVHRDSSLLSISLAVFDRLPYAVQVSLGCF